MLQHEQWLEQPFKHDNVQICELLIDLQKKYKHSFNWVCDQCVLCM